MAIRIEPSRKTIDREDVAKTVAVAMAYGAAGEPHGAFRFSLDALIKLRPAKGSKAGERAWFLWQEALAGTVAQVLPGEPWKMQPARLQQLTTDLLWASAERMRTSPVMLYGYHIERPRSFLPYESARRDIVLAVCTGSLADRKGELEKALNAAFNDAFATARQADPDYYANLIDDRTSVPAERQRQWDEHRDRIGREIMVEPIFGQDRITLHDLYIPPRCIFSSETRSSPYATDVEETLDDHHYRSETALNGRVQDLRNTVLDWWRTSDSTDRIRLVGGAPGSGKSSFAKMLAWEVGAELEECVLFIPLHRLRRSDTLRDDIRQYLTDANGGGFDAESDPLTWLGRPGQDNCLLIFDGLDELGAAQNLDRFGDLVQNLRDIVMSLDGSARGDGRVRVVVLGRNIAVAEAREKLGLSPEQWLEVLPMAPAPHRRQGTDDWVREKADQFGEMDNPTLRMLSGSDDRPAYWQKWQAAHCQNTTELPQSLQFGKLDEISAEPLLCYLLLLSGLAVERWEEVQANRGILFRKILFDIYERQWAPDPDGQSATSRDFARFLIQMAAFALAAWHGGGRVGKEEDFRQALMAYKPGEDKCFIEPNIANLKNVALMLHTRAEGQGNEQTFEFIHKSFGDYLVALAMADACLDWVSKSSNKRDQKSKLEFLRRWLALTGGAPISTEILDFLRGEIASDFQASDWPHSEAKWRGGVDLLRGSNHWREYRSGSTSKMALARRHLTFFCQLFDKVLIDGFPVHEVEKFGKNWRQHLGDHRNAEIGLLAILHSFSHVLSQTKKEKFKDALISLLKNEKTIFERNYYIRNFILHSLVENDGLSRLARKYLFTRLDVEGINFSGQSLSMVSMSHSNLCGANLRRSLLRHADLSCSDLSGVEMSGAVLRRADLSCANLRNARLSRADLSGANLSGADLSGAYLRRASLRGANLHGANLTGAYLTNADLSDANIGNTIFCEAKLEGAKISNSNNFEQPMIEELLKRGVIIQSI